MHQTDYDFDVISGPSTPPPMRSPMFRPPAPRSPPDAVVPARSDPDGAAPRRPENARRRLRGVGRRAKEHGR